MQTLATDVAVVGAGPIGLELAVALRKAGISYQHFDARQIGYTISWFAPGTRFFSSNERIAIAGVPLNTADQGKATREEYLAYLRGVVQQFDLQVNTYEPVVGIEREGAEFVLRTTPRGGERLCRARRLVLVTGGTDQPRRLNIPGEDLPHVSHYFRDPHIYFRKRVLIVGGKNSAVEAALRCYHAGARVSLSYRRAELPAKSIKYWLLPEINDLIKAGKMKGYFETVPVEIMESGVRLVRVGEGRRDTGMEGLRDRGTEGQRDGGTEPPSAPLVPLSLSPSVPSASIPFDFVLLLIGYEQDNTLLKMAGVELAGDCQAPVFDERTMQTSVPNVFVAGTAVGGTQDKYRVFIENCHVHVERIMAALTGMVQPHAPEVVGLPES